MPPVPPQAMTALLPLRGDPQPALETLHQGLAVLLCPLVVPESPDLLGGESVYSLGDLLHVHLVVAGYREGGLLRSPWAPSAAASMVRAVAPVTAPNTPAAVCSLAIAPARYWEKVASRKSM